ncbi:asparagine synthase (glutamine-hydrolyzing) [Massilia sp. DJPM01]|uniref:asparagine synthase (glutamine-hydrolyzing) n=1 Tax=Massilia sp. DJPM01 TaxID=3024404 RepID=UPI00259DBE5C|nr:asparagine synthase (glutamine-hydrolyzing) [Massilia sp. DJPM01]MDM5176108.1 asparagine synthase (glutamine-hydrolyzing) [Massilia sp. DJPM01]
MCGIAGLYTSRPDAAPSPDTIKKMLALIQHRGPDEAGYFIDDRLAMGTVRLSIIDVASGTQPLSDSAERYWICYNGELYNYKELRSQLQGLGRRFRTNSDTEVLLQAWIEWGEACLPRLNGAFGFAIYDTWEKSLFLARDRYGKRPLFYARKDGDFLFASEMKAFMGLKDFAFAADPQQLASIFAQWTPLPHQSGFKDIEQLPMGCFLRVANGQVVQGQYEQLGFKPTYAIDSEAEAIEQVRNSLSDSVRLRLRSDVEVGVYLSGGLDSAVIAQLATEMSNQQVHTFSVGFEDKYFDESDDQQEVSRFLGTSHSAITMTHADIAETFPQALYHAEMPAFRTAFVPMYLLSKSVRDKGIKVVLSGEGADEAFLGYDLFKETLLRQSWGNYDNDERKRQISRMYPYLRHFDEGHAAKLLGLFQQFTQEQMPGLFSHEIRFQNGRFANRLLNQKADPFAALLQLTGEDAQFSSLNGIEKAQWLEFKTLLSGYLLSTQGERMSLAHGVENRCPFLDPDVVNLAASVNLKFDDGSNEKYLIKKAFENRIPASIISKHKHPYRAPDSAAFAQHRPDYLELLLSESELKKMPYLDIGFAKALTKKIFSSDPASISTRENQAFIYLLSSAMLDRQFVRREGLPDIDVARIEKVLVRAVDQRSGVH